MKYTVCLLVAIFLFGSSTWACDNGVCVSDGITKTEVGPFHFVVPKGWSFMRSDANANQNILEMSPHGRFAEEVVTITYFKSGGAILKSVLKNLRKRKAKISRFRLARFRGQSGEYQEGGQSTLISVGFRKHAAIRIFAMSSKKKFADLKSARAILLQNL